MTRLQAKNSVQPQAEAGADLAHVYTLIHSFLKERSHTKAASALKKAVHGVITLDDSTMHEGPTLQKILEEWRELKAAADAIHASSSDSGSDSSDESSSEDDSEIEANLARKSASKPKPSSSSDDCSDDTDGTTQKTVTQFANLLAKDYQRDSSKTLSSADDPDSDEESTSDNSSDSSDDSDVDMDSSSVPRAKAGSRRKTNGPATSSSDATSSSSSDSDSSVENPLPGTRKRKAKSSSSSGSSSRSDSDSEDDTEVPTAKKSARNAESSSNSDSSSESDTSGSSSSGSSLKKLSSAEQSAILTVARTLAGSSSSESESEDELAETPVSSFDPDTRATKKRRANKEGTAVITATAKVQVPAGNGRGSKAPRKPNTPFQRVNVQAVKYHDDRLKDNSFESRGARTDDYGARANRDLIVTRGDGFRKEKNKKKRGSYRGGDITMQSHSFKFED